MKLIYRQLLLVLFTSLFLYGWTEPVGSILKTSTPLTFLLSAVCWMNLLPQKFLDKLLNR